MNQRIRGIAVIGLGAFVVIACGGGGGSATTQAPASDPTTTQAPASTSAEESGENVASTVATTASAGGQTAAGVCDLVTAEELAEVFEVPSVTTSVLAGPPDNCIVESDAGDPLTAFSISFDQAKVVFDALTADPASIEVPGIGDQAFFVQNTGLLVLKGDVLVVISISGGANLSEEEGIEAAKKIGAFAAGRM
jgi:hypothetical protein